MNQTLPSPTSFPPPSSQRWPAPTPPRLHSLLFIPLQSLFLTCRKMLLLCKGRVWSTAGWWSCLNKCIRRDAGPRKATVGGHAGHPPEQEGEDIQHDEAAGQLSGEAALITTILTKTLHFLHHSYVCPHLLHSLLRHLSQPLLLRDNRLPLHQDSTHCSFFLSKAYSSLAENYSCCAKVGSGAQLGGGAV